MQYERGQGDILHSSMNSNKDINQHEEWKREDKQITSKKKMKKKTCSDASL